MKTTKWFVYKENKPVHEGAYQVSFGEDGDHDFAEQRPFYWHWRRSTWYIEQPGRRPYQPEGWILGKLHWRGVSR
jgi:hypothetical protein